MGPILSKNILFTLRTLSFSFLFGTFWVLPTCASGLRTLRPLNKSSLISSQSLLISFHLVNTSHRITVVMRIFTILEALAPRRL